MSTETKKTRTPKLRFPEFRKAGAWEEKMLGSVCSSFSGGTPSTTNKEFYGGTIPFIRSAEINKEETELFLTDEGLKNSSAKLVNKGDVLVALYGANSGDVAVAKIDGAINQAILCLKSEANNPFIYQFLSFKKDWIVSRFIQGGQGNLSGDIIKSISLLFPKPNEQQKIAALLSSLDALLAAQSEKIRALQAHKKGLMQQLFPAEGETVPRVRFREFEGAGEWEEWTLANCISLISGLHLLPEEYGKAGEIPYLAGPSDFTNNKIDAQKWTSKSSNTAEAGDTLIVVKGSGVGELWYLTIEKIAIGRQLMAVRANGCNSRFLFYFLGLKKKQFEALGSGNLIPGLSRNDILDIDVKIPSPEEQQKIAAVLTSLDDLIAAQGEKLEVLKTQKKGLMQGLFPGGGGGDDDDVY